MMAGLTNSGSKTVGAGRMGTAFVAAAVASASGRATDRSSYWTVRRPDVGLHTMTRRMYGLRTRFVEGSSDESESLHSFGM